MANTNDTDLDIIQTTQPDIPEVVNPPAATDVIRIPQAQLKMQNSLTSPPQPALPPLPNIPLQPYVANREDYVDVIVEDQWHVQQQQPLPLNLPSPEFDYSRIRLDGSLLNLGVTYTPEPDILRGFAQDNDARADNAGDRALQSITALDFGGLGNVAYDWTVGSIAKAVSDNLHDYSVDPIIPNQAQIAMDQMSAGFRGQQLIGSLEPVDIQLQLFSKDLGPFHLEVGGQQVSFPYLDLEDGNIKHRDDIRWGATLSIPMGNGSSRDR
ncbi:MAG: hypothetical protein J0M34_09475 [Alphaproteobacteria bacterium]|nr:hypothetical protein [Alphaproteobacteria bacterium]